MTHETIHEPKDRKLDESRDRRRIKHLEANRSVLFNPLAQESADCLFYPVQNSICR